MTRQSRKGLAKTLVRFRLDESLRCVSVVEDRGELFGGSAEVLVGKRISEIFDPEEAPEIVETLDDAFEHEAGAEIRVVLPGPEPRRAVAMSVTPCRLAGSGAALLDVVWTEAPSRRKTDARPASAEDGPGSPSESRFEALLAHSSDSICEIDDDGRILYANPSYCELLGVSGQEVLGSDPLDSVHPEDRRRVAYLLHPGPASRRRNARIYRAQTLDGHSIFLETTAREYTGSDGRSRVVAVSRDVTEREQARQALERQIQLETRVAELSRFFIDLDIEAIREGIESRIPLIAELADVQRSWMYSFGAELEDFEVFDWSKGEEEAEALQPPDRAHSAFPYSTGIIRSGRVYHVSDVDVLPAEADEERQDMLERGVRSILCIPIMSKGQFVGCLGFESLEREIDWSAEMIMLLRMVGEIFYSALRRRRAARDLRDSQSQLMQAQKMEAVGTLAGGIAHDFNNHLAVMLGNARFVRQEIEAGPEILEAIGDIERSADHCAQLTRSLLAFSRRSPVEIQPVCVEELVQSVEGLVRPLLPSTIDLSTLLDPELGTFAVDAVQIQQVLVNLLVNARDAMPEGGPIWLRGRRQLATSADAGIEGLVQGREYIVLSVEDRGCGMDEEVWGRVFEPFFTTKSVGHGTGLGLAMAYGIVRQSEGAISVESTQGEGSTFEVYLPSADRAERRSTPKPRPVP